jgi:hypothetical protein
LDVFIDGIGIHRDLSLFGLLRSRHRLPEDSPDFGRRLCRNPDFSLRGA